MNDTNENMITEPAGEMSAGEMLRNARTTGRRKREIPTIAKQLCIREEFLQALEDGNYTQIPETVYILGFARNYAMELGLDPDEIVAKIKAEMGLASDGAGAKSTPSKSESDNDASAARRALAGVTAATVQFVRRKWIWVLSGLAALCAIIVLVLVLSSTAPADTDSETDDTVQVVAVADSVAEPEYGVDVRERFGVENRAKARVILQSLQESWVKVEDARGNTVFSRVLVPGDVYYVPEPAGNYKATFGNAGGVDIWVDGNAAPKAGAAHTRKTGISLNPDSLGKEAPSQSE